MLSSLVENASRLGGLLGLLVPGDLVVVGAVDWRPGTDLGIALLEALASEAPAAAALHLTTHRGALERHARQLGHLSRPRIDHEYLRERNLDEVQAAIGRWHQSRKDGRLVVVDTVMQLWARGGRRASQLCTMTTSLKSEARRRGLAIALVTSTHPPGGEMVDLEESGSLEDEADAVVLYHRVRELEVVRLAKYRRGTTGELPVAYDEAAPAPFMAAGEASWCWPYAPERLR